MLTLARIMQATAPSPSVPNAAACRVYKGTTISFFLTPELWPWPRCRERPTSSGVQVDPMYHHVLAGLEATRQNAALVGDTNFTTCPVWAEGSVRSRASRRSKASHPLPAELTMQLASQDSRLGRRTLSLRGMLSVFYCIAPLVFRNVPKQVYQGWFQSRESQSSTSNTSVCLDFWQVDYLYYLIFYRIVIQMTQVNY